MHKACLLGATFKFRIFGNDIDIIKESMNLREEIVAKGIEVGRTVTARIMEILSVKRSLEKIKGATHLNSAAVAEFYVSVNLAPDTEKVSESFVEKALYVWDRALSVDSIRTSCLHMEELFGSKSPLNSITKLNDIVSRCKTEDNISFIIGGVLDSTINKIYAIDTFNSRFLNGKNRSDKGYIGLLLQRKALLDLLAGPMIAELNLPVGVVERILDLKRGFSAYRSLFGGVALKVDLDWMGTLGPAGQAYLRVIEMAVYKYNIDETIHRAAMNAGRTPTEILEKDPFKEELDSVKQLLSQERLGVTTSGGSTGSTVVASSSAELAVDLNIQDILTIVTRSTTQDSADPADLDRAKAELMQKDEEGVLKDMHDLAERLIAEYVVLVVEPESSSALADALVNTNIGKLRGTPLKDSTYVGISYSVRSSGEAITHPHIRVPGFRKEHYEKLVRGVLLARGYPEDALRIDPGDAYIISDGGRHGNENGMVSAFRNPATAKPLNRERLQLFLHYSEESLRARRKMIKTTASGNQMEYLHVITEDGRAPRLRKNLSKAYVSFGHSGREHVHACLKN